MTTPIAAEVWRKYVIDGVPASGPNRPDKTQVIAWATGLETLLGAGAAGLAYATRSALNADLAHGANTTAIVYADAIAANNGLYAKSGSSGSGVWTRIGDLPTGVVRLTVTGGTANAIVATAPETPSAPGSKLYLFTPAANNTDAVMIAVNGGAAAPIKNALGSQLAANSLINNLPVLMSWQTDHYHILISVPVDATGVLNDTLDARDAASGYATAAASSASALGNQVHQYDTRALAAAATIPVSVAAIKITRYADGYPLAYATYIHGTSAGPMAFQEAAGNWWELDLSGKYLLAPWFGAKGDGSNDDTQAVQSAIEAAVGCQLDGMGLSYNITATINGVDNIDFFNATLIQGAHPAAHPVINFADKTNWKIRKIWFKSDYPTTLDYTVGKIGAIHFTNSTSGALENIAIEDCTFSDFADNYWVNGGITGSGEIRDFRFCRNRVLTTGLGAGAAYQPQFHAFLNLFGSGTSNNGIFVNPIIEGNHGDFDDIGIGFALWSRNKGFRINGNVIRNIAATSNYDGIDPTALDRNTYGIIVYDVLGDPPGPLTYGIDGEIAHNYILKAPSAGIYFASAEDVNVHDNIIIGQFRTDDVTLPRAGISCNDLRKSKVHHNRIIDCWGGIAVVAVAGSDTNELSDNEIIGSTASDAYGIRIGPPIGSSTTSTIAIKRNRVVLTGASARGLRQLTSVSNVLGPVVIEGNNWKCVYRSIDVNGMNVNGTTIIKDNTYSGVNSGGALVANSIVSHLVVQGEVFDLAASTGFGCNFGDSTSLAFIDCLFLNKLSGSECVTALGAKGTVDGIKFRNVAGTLRLVNGSLGYTAPTFGGITGDVVQNLSADAFTPSGGTIINGWICQTGTTWNALKTST